MSNEANLNSSQATGTTPPAAEVLDAAGRAPAPGAATSATSATSDTTDTAKPAEPLSLDLAGEKPPADGAAPVVYAATGDAGLDLALGFIGERGFGPDHPAVLAAQAGDFSLLETALKALGDKAKGYASYLAAGKQAWETRAKAQQEAIAKDRSTILEIVGGEGEWAKLQEWARANATEAERAEVSAALKQGGFVAKAVAQALRLQYVAATGAAPRTGTPVQNGGSRGAQGEEPLSPAAYGLAVAALAKKVGANRVTGSPEYAALQARRSAWQGR